MNRTFKSTTRLVLAAVFSGLGLMAQAQSIKFGTVLPGTTPPTPNCIAPAATRTLVFDPGALTGVTSLVWSVAGGGTISSTTGNSITFTASGKAKARVTATYVYNSGTAVPVPCPGGGNAQCGGVDILVQPKVAGKVDLDFYKTFATPAISGPLCVVAGNSLAYGVDPTGISDQANIQTGIGIDTYAWDIRYTPSGNPVTYSYTSGDQSSISIPAASVTSAFGNFIVKVKIGTCNPLITYGTVVVTQDLNAGTAITGFPGCRAVNASIGTTASFTINTIAGVNYTLSSPWTLSPSSIIGSGSAQTVTISNINRNTGDVIIRGVGTGGATCFGTQTAVKTLTRALVQGLASTSNTTTNYLSGCLSGTVGAPSTLTLNNAPINARLTWTLPTGWTADAPAVLVSGSTYTTVAGSAAATIVVRPNTTGGGVVDVSSDGCTTGAAPGTTGSPVVRQTIAVTGNQGCTYDIIRNPSGFDLQFSLSNTSGVSNTTCLPQGAGVVTYTWTAPTYPGVAPPNDMQTLTTNAPAVQFVNEVPPTSSFITVSITQTSGGCLSVPAFSLVRRPANPGGSGSGVGASHSRLARPDEVSVYPNPADGLMQIGLPELGKGATVRLVLTNSLGQEVSRTTTQDRQATMDVRNVATGTYLLRIELPGGQKLGRPVQVQH